MFELSPCAPSDGGSPPAAAMLCGVLPAAVTGASLQAQGVSPPACCCCGHAAEGGLVAALWTVHRTPAEDGVRGREGSGRVARAWNVPPGVASARAAIALSIGCRGNTPSEGSLRVLATCKGEGGTGGGAHLHWHLAVQLEVKRCHLHLQCPAQHTHVCADPREPWWAGRCLSSASNSCMLLPGRSEAR